MTDARPLVAICNYDLCASGTVRKSIEIATAASEAGLRVELWAIRRRGPLIRQVSAHVPVVEVSRLPGCVPNRAVDLALNVPGLAAAIRARRPSVLLSGGNHFHLPARAALAMARMNGKVQFIARASNSSRRARHNNLMTTWGDNLKYGGSDTIVAVSEELSDEIIQLDFPVPIYCIPNGVDVDKIRKLAREPFSHPFLQDRNDGHPLLTSMGRLTSQKGFDVLIAAFARISLPRLPRLLVIGDGEKAQRDKLERLAQEAGVGDRIAFLGYQANPFAIMAQADLFVSASRWEGSSNALLEALACGLPLVATECPTGSWEILTRGPFGTLAPVEDPEGLSQAIVSELSVGRDPDQQAAGAALWSLNKCLDQWTRLLNGEIRP